MNEPEVVKEQDWTGLEIGEYVRITCGQGRGRPKLVLMGVIDDWGHSDDLIDAMAEAEEDRVELPPDEMYLHCRGDDGSVSCIVIDMLVMSLKRGKIERFPDFEMSRADLDALLAGGH